MKRKSLPLAFSLLAGTATLPVAMAVQEGDKGTNTIPATPIRAADDKPQAPDAEKTEQQKRREEAQRLSQLQRELGRQIQNRDFKTADATIKELATEDKFPILLLQSARGHLLNQLANSNQVEEIDPVATAKEYLEQSLQESYSQAANPSALIQIAEGAAKIISAKEGPEAAAAYINSQIESANLQEAKAEMPEPTHLASALRLALTSPDLKLITAEQADAIYDEEIAKLLQSVNKSPTPASSVLLFNYWNKRLAAASPEGRTKLIQEISKLSHDLLGGDLDESKIQTVSLISSMLTSALRNDQPREAFEFLEKTVQQLESKKESSPQLDNSLKNVLARLKQMAQSLESSLKQVEMIGKPAPAFDAEHWVNGEGVTLDDLKGKVVLVDFWAVWCGPCIATFPELRKWHEEFSDKGLVIVGVTRQYNFVWDEENKTPNRSESEEVSVEDELNMLTKFIESYELPHATMVTPKGSSMNSDYAVTGIPHVALIDKEGNVALVQVGSGPQSAQRIHSKIKELLSK